MDKMDRQASNPPSAGALNVGTGDERLRRRIFMNEIPDQSRATPGGERVREGIEYVAVPRKIKYTETVTNVPVRRQYQDVEPAWQVQHVKRKIPKEVIEYEDKVTEVGHKRIVDEYVEVPYDAGEEVKCIPRLEVQEREIEVAVPRIKWVEKQEIIPEVREVVRYVEADHNIERVVRYVPESSDGGKSPVSRSPISVSRSPAPQAQQQQMGKSPLGGPQFLSRSREVLSPAMMENMEESRLQGVVLPRAAHVDARESLSAKTPVTVDIPVPFMVPKPFCIPVDVPLIRFKDNFVPIPGRRHVTPRLTFTGEVYDVPCVKEKPILVVQDYLKPVPVDCHIKIKEKDVKVKPMDAGELTQCDMHAMWMRANADLMDKYKNEHGGLYPRGYSGPEETKVPLKESDWEACIRKEDEEAKEAGNDQDTDPEGLGPLPLHPGHPLMMTFLQNQWIQNPTNTTHGMYTMDFFRHHYGALNAQLDPQCHQVNLTEEQMDKLGPMPHIQLPTPWKLVSNMNDLHTNVPTPGRPL